MFFGVIIIQTNGFFHTISRPFHLALSPDPIRRVEQGPRLGGTGTRDHEISHADRVGSLPLGEGENLVLALIWFLWCIWVPAWFFYFNFFFSPFP